MKKITSSFPQFVIGGKSALRLVLGGRDNYYYYRDGGSWSVDIKKDRNGDLFTLSEIKSVNNLKLTPITENQWRENNGPYAPSSFERFGWEVEESKNPCCEISLTETPRKNNKYLLIKRLK